jgi:hypothetical protein
MAGVFEHGKKLSGSITGEEFPDSVLFSGKIQCRGASYLV